MRPNRGAAKGKKGRFQQIAEEPGIGMDDRGNLNIVDFDPAYAEGGAESSTTNLPKSLVEDVERKVIELLDVTATRHRSALLKLKTLNGEQLVKIIHETIAENYRRSGASVNKDRSKENWRWPSLQLHCSPNNTSPEVKVERAIANACDRLKCDDWANQVPVASGLIPAAGDGRRAIDLVHKLGDRHFELIELKIASDTPLFAAIEIIAYGCLWLIARADKPTRPSALLDADHVDLSVLAPSAYYSPYALADIASQLDHGVRALGKRENVELSFAFKRLDDRIKHDSIPEDETLLHCLRNSVGAIA